LSIYNFSMKKSFAAVVVAGVLSLGGYAAAQRTSAPVLEVYKSPTCGCCANWIKHMEAAGFTAKVTEVEDMTTVKAKYAIPGRLQSCHTAVVNGYVLEGHVPAADVQKMLKERPAIAGLTVPGMPIGSPGMEVGTTVQPYDTLTLEKQGQQPKVYVAHR
jgi:hypothetical protein